MTTPASTNDTPLEKLTDSGLVLADATQDIRGRKVVDTSGVQIGHASALFIDEGERKVRMIEVRVGDVLGIGGHHVLLPVDAVTKVDAHEVHVNQTRAHVLQSPAYDPEIIVPPERDYWSPYYGYYGYQPYWGSGYLYPRNGIWP